MPQFLKKWCGSTVKNTDLRQKISVIFMEFGSDPFIHGQAFIDPVLALGGVPPSMPRVVLSHNPASVEDPRVTGGPRLDLMLSGHLHGGQIKLPFVGNLGINSRFRNKYIEGLVQAPTCQIVISRGVGMSVLPVRFGVPPELVEITLTRG